MFKVTTEKITQDIIENFFNGNIFIIHVPNWLKNNKDLEKFGIITEQDFYKQKEVNVGNSGIYKTSEMPWHCDRGYSDKIDDIAVLYCSDADNYVGKTLFCNMQSPVKEASKELLNKCYKEYDFKLSKYYEYSYFPVQYQKESHRRLHRKSKCKKKLLKKDSLGLFFTYNQAYSVCDFSEEIESLCYQPKNIYEHEWIKNDLLIFNNLKLNHKRESTSNDLQRELIRISLKSKVPMCHDI
jgi:alpha-ketoglutarate-dependent taurine dioxygenase